jgi:hypothetical protein
MDLEFAKKPRSVERPTQRLLEFVWTFSRVERSIQWHRFFGAGLRRLIIIVPVSAEVSSLYLLGLDDTLDQWLSFCISEGSLKSLFCM